MKSVAARRVAYTSWGPAPQGAGAPARSAQPMAEFRGWPEFGFWGPAMAPTQVSTSKARAGASPAPAAYSTRVESRFASCSMALSVLTAPRPLGVGQRASMVPFASTCRKDGVEFVAFPHVAANCSATPLRPTR